VLTSGAGALANLILSVVKIFAGHLYHSKALFADGIHSLSDLVSDIGACVFGVGPLVFSTYPHDATSPRFVRPAHSPQGADGDDARGNWQRRATRDTCPARSRTPICRTATASGRLWGR
jgi:hypothetical protein